MEKFSWKDMAPVNFYNFRESLEKLNIEIFDVCEDLCKQLKPQDLYFSEDPYTEEFFIRFSPKEYTDSSDGEWWDESLSIEYLLPNYLQDQVCESLFAYDGNKSKDEVIQDLQKLGFVYNKITECEDKVLDEEVDVYDDSE